MAYTGSTTLGGLDKAWSIAQLVDAALAVAPALPTEKSPDRRRKFTVIEGGKVNPSPAFCSTGTRLPSGFGPTQKHRWPRRSGSVAAL